MTIKKSTAPKKVVKKSGKGTGRGRKPGVINLDTPQKKEKFLILLKKNNGLLGPTLRESGVANQTYYNWCETDPQFKDACMNAKEILLDMTESALAAAVKNKEKWAVSLSLRYLGHARGYSEQKEAPLQVNIQADEIKFSFGTTIKKEDKDDISNTEPTK